ncbi:uncharacterized protein BDW70DRAFT_140036 [Aspergillus foveolatus]|uniref:uncharacterized protein n=1 Tax=Aspergillus foveolatus TaxID=210207 RepID=UPI003CCD5C61
MMGLSTWSYPPYPGGRHLVNIDIATLVYYDGVVKVAGLHLAAYLGVTKAIQTLRDRMSINARDSKGKTPLSYAAKSGSVGLLSCC